jgi:menaquinol-cytochrome c reductase iron-sulfur subunit
MDRRSILKYLSGTLATACAAVIGLPGISYIRDTLRHRGESPTLARRVARYNDLPAGTPVQVPLYGSQSDAWTVSPNEIIGRVWLVRKTSAPADDKAAAIAAFTAVCPHLGCNVQLDPSRANFVCPCHQAKFKFSGDRFGKNNPSRRSLDALESRLERDPATGEWWVVVNYEKFEFGSSKKILKA